MGRYWDNETYKWEEELAKIESTKNPSSATQIPDLFKRAVNEIVLHFNKDAPKDHSINKEDLEKQLDAMHKKINDFCMNTWEMKVGFEKNVTKGRRENELKCLYSVDFPQTEAFMLDTVNSLIKFKRDYPAEFKQNSQLQKVIDDSINKSLQALVSDSKDYKETLFKDIFSQLNKVLSEVKVEGQGIKSLKEDLDSIGRKEQTLVDPEVAKDCAIMLNQLLQLENIQKFNEKSNTPKKGFHMFKIKQEQQKPRSLVNLKESVDKAIRSFIDAPKAKEPREAYNLALRNLSKSFYSAKNEMKENRKPTPDTSGLEKDINSLNKALNWVGIPPAFERCCDIKRDLEDLKRDFDNVATKLIGQGDLPIFAKNLISDDPKAQIFGLSHKIAEAIKSMDNAMDKGSKDADLQRDMMAAVENLYKEVHELHKKPKGRVKENIEKLDKAILKIEKKELELKKESRAGKLNR